MASQISMENRGDKSRAGGKILDAPSSSKNRFLSINLADESKPTWTQMMWNIRYGPTLVVVPPTILARLPIIPQDRQCRLQHKDRIFPIVLQDTDGGVEFGHGWGDVVTSLRLYLGTAVRFIWASTLTWKFEIQYFRNDRTQFECGGLNQNVDPGMDMPLREYDRFMCVDIKERDCLQWTQLCGNTRYGYPLMRIPPVVVDMIGPFTAEDIDICASGCNTTNRRWKVHPVVTETGTWLGLGFDVMAAELKLCMGVAIEFTASNKQSFGVRIFRGAILLDVGEGPANAHPEIEESESEEEGPQGIATALHAIDSGDGNPEGIAAALNANDSDKDSDSDFGDIAMGSEKDSDDEFGIDATCEEMEAFEPFKKCISAAHLKPNGTVTIPGRVCKGLFGPDDSSTTVWLRTPALIHDFPTEVHYRKIRPSTKFSQGWHNFATQCQLRVGDYLNFQAVQRQPKVIVTVTIEPRL